MTITTRLDLTPEEATFLANMLAYSDHPARVRICREIADQKEAIALAKKNPELDTLRVISQGLIRDINAKLPPYCFAFLLTGEASDVLGAPLVYTSSKINRAEAAQIFTQIIKKWQEAGEI